MQNDDPVLREVRRKLEDVDAQISAHPLHSDSFEEARRLGAERVHDDPRSLDNELRSRGLPTLAKQARMIAFGTPSLARLNRKRLKLEQQLLTES